MIMVVFLSHATAKPRLFPHSFHAAITEQHARDAAAIECYLSDLLREHSLGINERYAGTFHPLTGEAETLVHEAFPHHRFVIADFLYSHWEPDDGSVKMLLVLDASSQVLGYCWSPWYSGDSETFADVLMQYTPASEEHAIRMVRALVAAIAATLPGFSVDFVTREREEITAFLLQNGKPWRVVHVPYAPKTGFGRLKLVNPITGDSDRSIAFRNIP
jgi:hypothetical protein